MNVREVLTHAARTTWTHKRLWFYGLFAATAGGGIQMQLDDGLTLGAMPSWIGPVLIAAAVVGVAVSVLHLLAEAALIEGVRDARLGQVAPIRQGLRAGWRHVLRVLGVKLCTALLTISTVSVAVAPVVLGLLGLLPLVAGIIATGLLAMPAMLLAVTLDVIGKLALRLVVLEGRPVVEALRHARRMLHTSLFETLGLLVGVALGRAGLSMVIIVPALVLGAVVGGLLYAIAGTVPAVVGLSIVVLPFGLFLAGLSGAWTSAVWTEGFTSLRMQAA